MKSIMKTCIVAVMVVMISNGMVAGSKTNAACSHKKPSLSNIVQRFKKLLPEDARMAIKENKHGIDIAFSLHDEHIKISMYKENPLVTRIKNVGRAIWNGAKKHARTFLAGATALGGALAYAKHEPFKQVVNAHAGKAAVGLAAAAVGYGAYKIHQVYKKTVGQMAVYDRAHTRRAQSAAAQKPRMKVPCMNIASNPEALRGRPGTVRRITIDGKTMYEVEGSVTL